MKYLKDREIFLKEINSGILKYEEYDHIISEALSNDIAWGDSLLGRLINSIARKTKVGYNLKRGIEPLIKSLKVEFDKLTADAVFKKIGEEDVEYEEIINKTIVHNILKLLIDSVEKMEKITILITITQDVIDNVNNNYKKFKMSDDVKKRMIDKLEEFLKFLNTDITEGEKKKLKELGPSKEIGKLGQGGENGLSVINKENGKGDDISKLYKKAAFLCHPDHIKEYGGLVSEEELNKDFNELTEAKERGDVAKIKSIIDKYSRMKKNDSIVLSYLDFILINEDQLKIGPGGEYPLDKKGEEGLTKIDKPKDKPKDPKHDVNDDPETIDVPYEEIVDPKKFVKRKHTSEEIKIEFYKIFSKKYLKDWEVSKEDITKTEKKTKKVFKELESDGIVINGIDPIIEIVKLFNKAHKIYWSSVIPSHRSDGRVSNLTFREYTWVGDSGDGGTPDRPSTGGWRNNTLFDKWEEGVLDIIKDSKYQVLFNENTVIRVGKADPRVNVSKDKSDRVKQGGGKTLLKLINSLLDGEKLYKNGAQSSFISEYFNVNLKDSEIGYYGGKSKISPFEDEKEFKASFKRLKKGDYKYDSGIYVCRQESGSDGKPHSRYFYIFKTVGDFIIVKYSSTFKELSPKNYKISQGDFPNKIKIDVNDKDNKPYVYFIGKCKVSDFKNGIWKIEDPFNIRTKNNGDSKDINFDDLYQLVDNDDKVVEPHEDQLKKWDKELEISGIKTK